MECSNTLEVVSHLWMPVLPRGIFKSNWSEPKPVHVHMEVLKYSRPKVWFKSVRQCWMLFWVMVVCGAWWKLKLFQGDRRKQYKHIHKFKLLPYSCCWHIVHITTHNTSSNTHLWGNLCQNCCISRAIDHLSVVCSMTWPLNGSTAAGDLVLINTSLFLLCKLSCSYAH